MHIILIVGWWQLICDHKETTSLMEENEAQEIVKMQARAGILFHVKALCEPVISILFMPF